MWKNSLLLIDLTLTHDVSLCSWNMFWSPSPHVCSRILTFKTNSFRRNSQHSCIIRILESSTAQHSLTGRNNDAEFIIKRKKKVSDFIWVSKIPSLKRTFWGMGMKNRCILWLKSCQCKLIVLKGFIITLSNDWQTYMCPRQSLKNLILYWLKKNCISDYLKLWITKLCKEMEM